MNLIHRFLSTWFGFNKQQRNGVIVLCAIILILFIIRLSVNFFIEPKSALVADFSKTDLSKLENLHLNTDSTLTEKQETVLFVFNPNTVNKEQLIQLGFKEKTANTFLKYRSKGAIFKTKEDVKKVYGISPELYATIEPYIFIEVENKNENKLASAEKPIAKKEIKVIELNSADSVSLLPLPGIGGGYAKRILKYRSLLGGFYSTEQLKEVYGFSDSLYLSVKNYVKADAALVSKLNLNTENFKELNAHPYISYEETKAIFNWRRKNGAIKSKVQVIEIVGEATFKKIEAYLGF
ncbi:MAG: helix-hairpin-helix domain-containing protein [Bacteroidia bacterium]|nr:helix-hairpin-helix domain-containing protein [Bacteroidia bacterium]